MRLLSHHSSITAGILTAVLLPTAQASPLWLKRADGIQLAIDANFPDPSFLQAPDGMWYAFGTNGNGKHIQVASSPDFNTWTLLNVDALPNISSWETANNHWAPDVHLRVGKLIFL
jgi:hypothetical protein